MVEPESESTTNIQDVITYQLTRFNIPEDSSPLRVHDVQKECQEFE
jgi:hypothetical protein